MDVTFDPADRDFRQKCLNRKEMPVSQHVCTEEKTSLQSVRSAVASSSLSLADPVPLHEATLFTLYKQACMFSSPRLAEQAWQQVMYSPCNRSVRCCNCLWAEPVERSGVPVRNLGQRAYFHSPYH
jgi:hypothetical protein